MCPPARLSDSDQYAIVISRRPPFAPFARGQLFPLSAKARTRCSMTNSHLQLTARARHEVDCAAFLPRVFIAFLTLHQFCVILDLFLPLTRPAADNCAAGWPLDHPAMFCVVLRT